MIKRTASATWKGDLPGGEGRVELGSGAFSGRYSFLSRFKEGTGTNPEELIGAAHAGCFSMSLAHTLAQNGHPPAGIETQASVVLEKTETGFSITRITLTTRGDVPGVSREQFLDYARDAKENCPVSRIMTGVDIVLEAELEDSK